MTEPMSDERLDTLEKLAVEYHCDYCDYCATNLDVHESCKEIRRLREELNDWKATHKAVMESPCPDEQHCTCVPELRAEVEYLKKGEERQEAIILRQRAEVERLKQEADSIKYNENHVRYLRDKLKAHEAAMRGWAQRLDFALSIEKYQYKAAAVSEVAIQIKDELRARTEEEK